MTMQGIDISNWQAGINLAAVPCDFVIVKCTQGTGYVSPDAARQVEQALSLGKAVGIYHYINGAGANAEAEYFYNNCKGWMGKVVWCLDWESIQNGAWGNTGYLDQCIKRLAQLTGKPPIVYASSSVFPSAVASANNCGTWVAQYANMNATGYQDTPWNEGAYGCTIRQYSSSGRLNGYNGSLDLNKFYGDRAAWNKYIAGGSGSPAPTPAPAPSKKSNDEIANEVINGQWGNDPDRTNALRAAGYDAGAIQAIVNQKLGASSSSVKYYRVQSGDTVSGIAARFGVGIGAVSGFHSGNPNLIYPGEVLTIRVGGSASAPAQSNVIHYTVRSGDTVSGIAAKYGVGIGAVSGFRSGNPNLIYPGETLTIRK